MRTPRHFETARRFRDLVEQEFRDFLRCGWLAGSFARVRCAACGQGSSRRLLVQRSRLLPAVRAVAGAERSRISSIGVSGRTVSIMGIGPPNRLRYLLAWNHELCRAVTGAAPHYGARVPARARTTRRRPRRPERPNPRCVRGGGAESARYANSQTAPIFPIVPAFRARPPGTAATQFLARPGEASRPTREAARGSFVPVTALARAAL